MKLRKLLLILPLLLGSLLSCNNTSEEKDYYTVTFYNNYNGDDSSIYKTQIVAKNQLLLEPSDPTQENYIFKSWCLDKQGKKDYSNEFNKLVSSDLKLYASWIAYDDLEDSKKVNLLLDTLNDKIGLVTSCYTLQTSTTQYAVEGGNEYVFYTEKDMKRYQDITTCDYYDKDKSSLLAQQQYFYDNQYFYNILNDLSGEETSKKTSAFNKDKIDSFLNIDFVNLFCYKLKDLKYLFDTNADMSKYEYELLFNPTLITSNSKEFTFEFNMYHYDYNDNLGCLVEEYFMFEVGISFLNGFINGSIVKDTYILALDGAAEYIDVLESETTYTLGSSYPSFTGQKFNPENFE